MPQFTRITFDPQVMGGKPCVRETRVTVGTIVGLVASGISIGQILAEYPYLEHEDVMEALAFARESRSWVDYFAETKGFSEEFPDRIEDLPESSPSLREVEFDPGESVDRLGDDVLDRLDEVVTTIKDRNKRYSQDDILSIVTEAVRDKKNRSRQP